MAGTLHGTHGGTGLKDAGDLRVHLYVQVALLGPLLVPGIDSAVDPLLEGLSNNSTDYVRNVLPRELINLGLDQRKGSEDIIVGAGELEEVLDCQALELRHRHMLNLLGLQHLTLAADEIFHMKDRHGFIRAQVGTYVMGEEPVNLAFARILRTERLGRHHGQLSITSIDRRLHLRLINMVRHLIQFEFVNSKDTH